MLHEMKLILVTLVQCCIAVITETIPRNTKRNVDVLK